MVVPKHDVLAAGFPCQPFSKSGFQRGMDEARGTLFWNICEILRVRKPSVVLLENVRNIAGPRHTARVGCDHPLPAGPGLPGLVEPIVFSPHLLPPERGGRPQVRERVFIVGTYVGVRAAQADVTPAVPHAPVDGWDPREWDLAEHLPLQRENEVTRADGLASQRGREPLGRRLERLRRLAPQLRRGASCRASRSGSTPSSSRGTTDHRRRHARRGRRTSCARTRSSTPTTRTSSTPGWRAGTTCATSRRRAASSSGRHRTPPSLYDTVMHFRPSGIRAKRATYLPALVAITQTSILGDRAPPASRRARPHGCRGCPSGSTSATSRDAATYKQTGNGVNVGAAYHVLREHASAQPGAVAKRAPDLAKAVLSSPASPDALVERHFDRGPAGHPTRPAARRGCGAGAAV